jgi:hypothetical protein
METTFINKRGALAAAIARDILKTPVAKPQENRCLSCARPMSAGRFCHQHCRDWFDAGGRPFSEAKPRYSLPIGPHGFLIACKGCGKTFDSKGWYCCSPECQRRYRDKQELDAELKDDSFRAVKRKCIECGGDIPNWRKGRRVSKATKFCGPKCQRKTAKNEVRASGEVQADSVVETAKKCPGNRSFLVAAE